MTKHTRVRLTLVALEALVALTSIACGIGLVVGAVQLPAAWLAGTPFGDYTLPGLVMAVVVGGSAALAAELTRAGRAGGVVASILAGLLLMGCEVAEVALLDPNLGRWLPFALGLQALYSALSLSILGLAVFLWRTEARQHDLHFQSRRASQV
jgi:hypothetical protein